MNWDDLRVFLAVHRRGSHKGAARLLAINPTTVGRRIAALEGSLGVKLFHRTPEQLRATPAGLVLLAHAERIESEILASQCELAGGGEELAGPLRVTATDGLVHNLLLPELKALRQRYPALRLELRSDTRVLDLSRCEADVAVRLVRPREPALVARRMGEMRFGLFGSLGYLERRGAPRNLEALAAHDWIGFDAELATLPQVRWLERRVPQARYVLRTNTTTAQLLACTEGHGLALLPAFVAAREPRLPRLEYPARELWGVCHADVRDHARVSAFLTWLRHVLGVAGAPASSVVAR